MRLTGSFYFGVVLMIVMAITIVGAIRMPYLESKLLPLIICIVVFITTGIGLIGELTGKKKPQAGEGEVTFEQEEVPAEDRVAGRWGGYLNAVSWILGFLLAVFLVGFLVSVPVFLLAYSRMNGSRWVASVVFAGAVTLVIWGMFEAVLRLELFRGVLFGGIIE